VASKSVDVLCAFFPFALFLALECPELRTLLKSERRVSYETMSTASVLLFTFGISDARSGPGAEGRHETKVRLMLYQVGRTQY